MAVELPPLRSRIVCRFDAELEAGLGDYEWVNRALFVAIATRGPSSVVYDLHQIL